MVAAVALGIGQVLAGGIGAGAARRAGRLQQRGINQGTQLVQQGIDESLTHLSAGTDYALGANQPMTSAGIGALTNINTMLGMAAPTTQTIDYDSQLKGLRDERHSLEEQIKDMETTLAGRGGWNKKSYYMGDKYKGLHRDQLADKITELKSKVSQVDTKLTSTQRLAQQQAQVVAQQQAQQAAIEEAQASGSPIQRISPFKFDGANFEQDPSYQFRLNQGLEALNRSYAARGGLGSGNRMIGITDYAQGLASTEYQSAFDRELTQWKSQFDVLNANLDILGYGQRATEGNINAVTGGALNAANTITAGTTNMANLRGAGGSNQAAATLGQNSAIQQTLQNLTQLGGQAGWFDSSSTTSDPYRSGGIMHGIPDIGLEYTGR